MHHTRRIHLALSTGHTLTCNSTDIHEVGRAPNPPGRSIVTDLLLTCARQCRSHLSAPFFHPCVQICMIAPIREHSPLGPWGRGGTKHCLVRRGSLNLKLYLHQRRKFFSFGSCSSHLRSLCRYGIAERTGSRGARGLLDELLKAIGNLSQVGSRGFL